MQDLSLEELLVKRDQYLSEILRRISDLRSSEEIKSICSRLFLKFPECNGIVLVGAYKDDRGERFVYGFDEIEESRIEGTWLEELDESLVTINYWISENRPSKWEPEIEDLFENLASVCPYPIEEEIDWQGMDLGSKFEILLLKNGEYV